MAKIIGLGGVFFKAADPKAVLAWYRDVLGLETDDYGFAFKDEMGGGRGFTQWSPFKADTTYFEPSEKPYMLNFRVDNLEIFLVQLAAKGVEEVGERVEEEYGKFGYIMDPFGTKIELWEPPNQ